MDNLTNLRSGFPHLSENPALVLQVLPNFKTLTLWNAYKAKHLGEEFCSIGAFPKLEVLIIAYHVLEEWTEIEEGALPSLKYLQLHNCLKLRMLILLLLDEHKERLICSIQSMIWYEEDLKGKFINSKLIATAGDPANPSFFSESTINHIIP